MKRFAAVSAATATLMLRFPRAMKSATGVTCSVVDDWPGGLIDSLNIVHGVEAFRDLDADGKGSDVVKAEVEIGEGGIPIGEHDGVRGGGLPGSQCVVGVGRAGSLEYNSPAALATIGVVQLVWYSGAALGPTISGLMRPTPSA